MKNTNQSIFIKTGWRENPQILDGDYKVANINLKYGDVNFILPSEKFEYEFFAETYLGQKSNDKSYAIRRTQTKVTEKHDIIKLENEIIKQDDFVFHEFISN